MKEGFSLVESCERVRLEAHNTLREAGESFVASLRPWIGEDAEPFREQKFKARGWKKVDGRWVKNGVLLDSNEGNELDPLVAEINRFLSYAKDMSRLLHGASADRISELQLAFMSGESYGQMIALDMTATGRPSGIPTLFDQMDIAAEWFRAERVEPKRFPRLKDLQRNMPDNVTISAKAYTAWKKQNN